MSLSAQDDKMQQLKQQLLQALVNREADDTAWMKIIDGMSNNQVRILKKEVKLELRKRRKNGGVNAQANHVNRNPKMLGPNNIPQGISVPSND
jgi:hypothetical protein